MIDPSHQARGKIEILKKEREKYDPNDKEWYELSREISGLQRTISRYEKMKKDGIKF